MSIEKFLRRNQMIADYLQQVAQQQEQMHRDGVLQPASPMMREMFQAQERLITALERVLELPARIAA